MVVSSIDLYDMLADQLGKDKAKTLVEFVEAKVEDGLKDKTSVFATKEDIQLIRLELQTQINRLLVWLVACIFSAAGIIIAVIKFL
jgi:hypothetical protein